MEPIVQVKSNQS